MALNNDNSNLSRAELLGLLELLFRALPLDDKYSVIRLAADFSELNPAVCEKELQHPEG